MTTREFMKETKSLIDLIGRVLMAILKAIAIGGFIILWIGLDSITTMLIG